MTAHEAREGFVGSQTPAEFMEESRKQGHADVEQAVTAYVAEINSMFGMSESTVELAEIGGLLAEYINGDIVCTIGRPWNAATRRLDWRGLYPVLDGSDVIIAIVDASEGDAAARVKGYVFDEGADAYRVLSTVVAGLVSALNAFKGDNLWDDIITCHFLFDEDATAEADPSGMNDIVVLTSGTQIGYFEADREWRVC